MMSQKVYCFCDTFTRIFYGIRITGSPAKPYVAFRIKSESDRPRAFKTLIMAWRNKGDRLLFRHSAKGRMRPSAQIRWTDPSSGGSAFNLAVGRSGSRHLPLLAELIELLSRGLEVIGDLFEGQLRHTAWADRHLSGQLLFYFGQDRFIEIFEQDVLADRKEPL